VTLKVTIRLAYPRRTKLGTDEQAVVIGFKPRHGQSVELDPALQTSQARTQGYIIGSFWSSQK